MGKRGPKPKGLTSYAERQIGEMAGQGHSAPEIASRLGVSERTVSRRLAALRGPLKPRAVSPAIPQPAVVADVAEGIVAQGADDDAGVTVPTDAELEEAIRGGPETIDQVLAILAGEFQRAAPGPLKLRAGESVMKALEIRRKATPPPKPDPNDNPDMVALGRTVAERLHKMVDLVCEEARQG